MSSRRIKIISILAALGISFGVIFGSIVYTKNEVAKSMSESEVVGVVMLSDLIPDLPEDADRPIEIKHKVGADSISLDSKFIADALTASAIQGAVNQAEAETLGDLLGDAVGAIIGKWAGPFVKVFADKAISSSSVGQYIQAAQKLLSYISLLSGQGSLGEPFGGRAWGIPCCNGWLFYHDATVHGPDGLFMAWWFSIKQYYLPTIGNWVLGTVWDLETSCYIFLPPYSICTYSIDAEYTVTMLNPGVGTSLRP